MIRLEIDARQWQAQIERIADLGDRRELMESIAEIGANQAKRRIEEEKRTPDGQPWKPWSQEYARTRESHHSLLIASGNMQDGLFGEVDGDNIVLGSDREYSSYVQDSRPFLGLSDANVRELDGAINDWVAQVIG